MWNKIAKRLLTFQVWIECGLQVGGYLIRSLSSAGSACQAVPARLCLPGYACRAEDWDKF